MRLPWHTPRVRRLVYPPAPMVRTFSRAAVVTALVIGCGGGGTTSPNPVPGPTGPALPNSFGLVAHFEIPASGLPAPLQVPFPTDLYRSSNGTINQAALRDWSRAGLTASPETFSQGFSSLDGFGRVPGAMFLIDLPSGSTATIPLSSFTPSGAGVSSVLPYVIVDIDPHPASPAIVPCIAGYVDALHILNVQPDQVTLLPGHQYAVVVTSSLVTSTGPLGASPEFAAIRDNTGTARSTPAGMLYGPAIDRVAAAGIPRGWIADIAVFTTQTTHAQLRIARDALVGGMFGPPPTLNTDAAMAMPYSVARFGASAHTGWTATLDEWMGHAPQDAMGHDLPGEPDGSEPATTGWSHDAIGAVLSGTFVSPEFRRPWLGDALSIEGTFNFANGPTSPPTPVDPHKYIPITLVLPLTAAPAGGYPVVIYGHGLGGQRQELFGVANELARAGIATIGIDTATFGQRADGDATDATSLFHAAGTYQGPDGLPDQMNYDSTTFYGGLSNILSLRDNVRQTVLDYVQVHRLVGNPALDLSFVADQYAGTAPHLDPAHVGYIGDSLGGIIGSVFTATEPTVNPVVLNVPGAGLVSALAADSPGIGPTMVLAASTIYHFPASVPVDRWHPLASLVQAVFDGADPASFASLLGQPTAGEGHDIYFTEVDLDETVPNRSNELLARSIGIAQVSPTPRMVTELSPVTSPVMNNANGHTRALVLQVPATHGSNLQNRHGDHNWLPPFPRDATPMMRVVPLPHAVTIREPIVAYQQSIVHFFQTAWTGAAVIDASALPILPDWDDDGWTDTEEVAAMTNPYDPTSHPSGAPPHTRNVGF